MMTQKSDSLTVISSEEGKTDYVFFAPLFERYSLSKEPYTEFRKGVKVESFNDSTGIVESTLVADYAIFLEKQELWEAKGNVVAFNYEGQKLETQQLFWNQKTKKIYSNVDTRVTQPNGEIITGVGFESDESMNDWVFRRPKGQVIIDTDPTDESDTTSHKQPAARPSGEASLPSTPEMMSGGNAAVPSRPGEVSRRTNTKRFNGKR